MAFTTVQRHGAALEVVTSRMRLIASQVQNPIRIVGLCTSLANAKDLGEWIGAKANALFNFPPGASLLVLSCTSSDCSNACHQEHDDRVFCTRISASWLGQHAAFCSLCATDDTC